MRKTAGRSERSGITLQQAIEMFKDEESAERWFEKWRWPDGPRCVACGSSKVTRTQSKPGVPSLRCAAGPRKDGTRCRKRFSVKTNTFMHSSKLPLYQWGRAIYLMATNLKGVSSMKLHRDLRITQKTAWYMLHRIRESGAYAWHRPVRKINLDAVRLGGRESGRTMLKRARDGTFHHLSDKHLGRYAGEFVGRQKDRPHDTEEQMGRVVALGEGRWLPYKKLVMASGSGRSRGARRRRQ